jgi:putative flippase GtrA
MGNNNHEEIISTSTIEEKVVGSINKIWSIRFIRFLFVGGINTVFGYLVFSVFILLQIHYSIASLLATILGVLFNYFATGKIVFNNSDPKLLTKFFGVYGITYLVNLIFLKIFNNYHVNMLIAGAILVFPSAILSYFLNKTFVFRVKNDKTF